MKHFISDEDALNSAVNSQPIELHLPQTLISSIIRKSYALFGFDKSQRDDLEQETWVKLLTEKARQKLSSLSERELKNYVTAIARNNAIDWKRRQKLENKYFEHCADDEFDQLASGEQTLDDGFDQYLRITKIWLTIKGRLSHKQKFVLLLEDESCISSFVRHGICTFDEIAKELKLSSEILKQVFIGTGSQPPDGCSNHQLGDIFEAQFNEKMSPEQVSSLRYKAVLKLKKLCND